MYMNSRHNDQMEEKRKELERFYWRTTLHKLYDKVQPFQFDTKQILNHKDKIAEIEKWLAIYITELKRIKANVAHL